MGFRIDGLLRRRVGGGRGEAPDGSAAHLRMFGPAGRRDGCQAPLACYGPIAFSGYAMVCFQTPPSPSALGNAAENALAIAVENAM